MNPFVYRPIIIFANDLSEYSVRLLTFPKPRFMMSETAMAEIRKNISVTINNNYLPIQIIIV
jgi:hypothetical protein